MKQSFLLFISLTLISSILSSQDFTVQKGGNCFTMDIPAYMTRTFQLNDVASIQYQNTSRSAYVIVIEDDKAHLESLGFKFVNAKDFLDNFANEFKKDAKDRMLVNPKEFIQNGQKHAQVDLYWTEDENKFYMLITGVETPEHFYKIMCWTPIENKSKVSDDFLRMSKSLKE